MIGHSNTIFFLDVVHLDVVNIVQQNFAEFQKYTYA